MFFFFFSSRRRHTRLTCDWSSDVCSSDLIVTDLAVEFAMHRIPFEQMRQSMRVSEIVDGEDLLDLFLCHGAKDVASDAPETVDCVIGHKRKLKIEGLNRYAENAQRPTPNDQC